MFPPAGASVYYNEAGESLGWDVEGEPEYNPDHYLPDYGDDDDDEYEGPDTRPEGRPYDFDTTHKHTSECTSLTCYERYIELEYDGPDHVGAMTREEWKRG